MVKNEAKERVFEKCDVNPRLYQRRSLFLTDAVSSKPKLRPRQWMMLPGANMAKDWKNGCPPCTILFKAADTGRLGFGYRFRPNRNPHRALDAVWVGIIQREIRWVLDADIPGDSSTTSTMNG